MGGFASRTERADRFTMELRERLDQMGITSTKFGQEDNYPPDFMKLLRKCPNNEMARFLRYRPDLALIVRTMMSAYLCETKSGTGVDCSGKEWPDFTYEVESYLAVRCLNKPERKVFVVYGDWTAAWISTLKFKKIRVPSNRYSEQQFQEFKSEFNREIPGVSVEYFPVNHGSKTPMAFVPRSQFLKLDEFVYTQLNPLETVPATARSQTVKLF